MNIEMEPWVMGGPAIFRCKDCKQQVAINEQHECKPKTEMTSLTEIKARLAAIEQGQREESKLIFNAIMGFNERVKVIEQGQGVLCERLDGLAERLPTKLFAELASVADAIKRLEETWDCREELNLLRGQALLAQFKANGHKPKRRKKR